MNKRAFLQCKTSVNRDAVTRRTEGGIEYIIVNSVTLPDDIVMNGGMYPADEIANSFQSLERTLAPLGHPHINGEFLPATDPIAINHFYVGAYNVNVIREGGRVLIEKHINVAEAQKTDRGKRLLDRVAELETSESPRPIHTSVGVFLEIEETDGLQTNAAGQEYSWIARNMQFDHDAILLDEVGAAQPSDGVGMAVNSKGEQVEVHTASLDIEPEARDMRVNADGASFEDIREQLHKQIDGIVAFEWMYITDVFDDEVIFETNQGFFTVPWRLDEETARIVGIPIRVDKVTTYIPKVNSKGDIVKELVLNALEAAGIKTEGLDDAALFAAYNELQTVKPDDASKGDVSEIVANAVAPLVKQIKSLEEAQTAGVAAQINEMAELVGNSDKYQGIDVDAAKSIPVETLKAMAANCQTAHGLLAGEFKPNADDGYAAPADMPE